MIAALLTALAALAPAWGRAQHAQPNAETATPVTLSVEPAVAYQTMSGFGTTHRLFEDPHFLELCEGGRCNPPTGSFGAAAADHVRRWLYAEGGWRRISYVSEGLEPENDNEDPATEDKSRFRFGFKAVDGLAEDFVQARAYGPVEALAYTFYERWMKDSSGCLRDDMIDEAVEHAFVFISRWRERAGQPLSYWIVANEPDLMTCMSPEQLRRLTRGLGRRLAAAGLPTKLVIPNVWKPENLRAFALPVLEDPAARRYVGALSYHAYDGYDCLRCPRTPAMRESREAIKALARRYALPVWMTEISGYSDRTDSPEDELYRLLHLVDELTQADASAWDYMWAAWPSDFWKTPYQADGLVAARFDRATGALASLERPLRYYVLGHWSRFVRPGMRRIRASTRAAGLAATAFENPASGGYALVLVNAGDAAASLRVLWAGRELEQKAQGLRTTAHERWRRLDPVSLSSVHLPARSVTTLYGTRPNQLGEHRGVGFAGAR